jgi:hypothetical protein
MSEYYIREIDCEEARGPYSVDKLAAFVESGQMTKETLYYDEEMSAWLRLGDSPHFAEDLFPVRRKLSLRKADAPESESTAEGDSAEKVIVPEKDLPGPDIAEILAAADGRTEETQHLRKRQRSAAAAARYLCTMMGLAFLMSAFTLLYPNFEWLQSIIVSNQWDQLLKAPFIWVGVVDLFIALCCFLAVSEIFPIIRIRAALGFGFALYVGWAGGDFIYLIATLIAMTGLWTATCTQRLWLMLIAFIAIFGGMGVLVWMALQGSFEQLYSTLLG